MGKWRIGGASEKAADEAAFPASVGREKMLPAINHRVMSLQKEQAVLHAKKREKTIEEHKERENSN